MSSTKYRIQFKYYQLIFNSVLIGLTIYLSWAYASVWVGNDILPYVEQQVYGLIDKPFVYRQLVPVMARILTKISGIRADVAVVTIIIFFAIGFAYSYRYLYTAFWKNSFFADFTTILCVELLFLLVVKDKKIYDIATVFLITLALGLLARQKFVGFFLLYPLACLNRETTFLLTVFFAIFYFKRIDKRTYWFGLVYQSLIYLAIRLALGLWFIHNPGTLAYYRPLENIRLYIAHPFTTFISVAFLLLILYFVINKWSGKPIFLRVGFVVFFPILMLLYVILGVSFEFRVFIEVYPIVFLLAIPLLVETLKIRPNPLTLASSVNES